MQLTVGGFHTSCNCDDYHMFHVKTHFIVQLGLKKNKNVFLLNSTMSLQTVND